LNTTFDHCPDVMTSLMAPRLPPLSLSAPRPGQIWRKREADLLSALRQSHDAEIREIHELYRQRAPYETAVGRTRLGELKRQLRLQVRERMG